MDYLEIRELYHHGVKGQRWGVRRYQNPDGTLTAEGKARYGVDENGRMSKEGKKLYAQDRRDQKVLDRSSAKNAVASGAKTFAKYTVAELAVAGASAIASYAALSTGHDTAAAFIEKGGSLTNEVLSAVGGVHVIVNTVKGANEKEKILKSQQGGN